MRCRVPRSTTRQPHLGPAPAAPERPAAAQRAAAPLPRHDISRVPIADVSQRRAPNKTGLPDGLKAGIEARSGLSMDGVRVHYRSSEPARLNAHAFTRGSDIHLAPGQDRHLQHEAWHVVQQAEGRVRPTIEVSGARVNDDAALEREADTLGASSAAHGASLLAAGAPGPAPTQLRAACVQRVIKIKDDDLKGQYTTKGGGATKMLISDVESKIGGELARGWKGWIADQAGEKGKTYSYTTDSFLDELKSEFPKKDTSSKIRPNFPSSSYWLGGVTREIQTGEDQSDLKPSEENLALPHRFPYKSIEDSTGLFLSGQEDSTDLFRWTGRLIDATKKRRDLNKKKIKSKTTLKKYEKVVDTQLDGMERARKRLKTDVESGKTLDLSSSTTQDFLKFTNALHGNVPDYGPHIGVNIQVSNRTHLNIEEDGTLTPGSLAAGSMSPHRGRGVARTKDGKRIVTTGGYKFDPNELSKKLQKLLDDRGYDNTTIDKDDLEEY